MQIDYLSTTAVARQLAVDTRGVVNWIRNGVVIDGRLVKLQGIRAGRNFRTTQEWVDAFVRECTGGTPNVQTESEAAHQRRAKVAQERLRESLRQKRRKTP
jgi:hypothetical protein